MSYTRTTDIRYAKVVNRSGVTAQTYFTRGDPLYFSGGTDKRHNSIDDNEKYTPELIAEDIKKRIEAVMADPSVRLEVVIMIDEQFQ